jgi:predicted thioesterase
MKAVPIGTRHELERTVEFKHTLTFHHAQLPEVFSTPDMIRLMETTAFFLLQPYCEGDEISVGTAINIEHLAASGVGARIRSEAVLESFDGKFYGFRVLCWEGEKEVGRGTIARAIVNVGRFLAKLKKVGV